MMDVGQQAPETGERPTVDRKEKEILGEKHSTRGLERQAWPGEGNCYWLGYAELS